MKKRRDQTKDGKSPKPDLPSRPWYKNTMAIFGLVSAIVATVSGLIVVFQQFQSTQVFRNTVIVFDRSAEMNAPFDGGTKLDAAIKAVNEALTSEVADTDNLALRSFGGSCDSTNSEMLIGFRQKNETRVRAAIQNLQAGGAETLTSAIIEATGDFSDLKRFEGTIKRIIVITGGGDDCESDPATFIRNRLAGLGAGKDIQVSFRFVGMALNPEQRDQLTAIAEETGGLSNENVEDQVFFVDNANELKEALTGIIEVEPIVQLVHSMATSMNDVTDKLNLAVNAVSIKDYSGADENLKAAKDEFNKSQPLLAGLKQGLSVELFHEQLQDLYDLTAANQELQKKQLELLPTMIDQGKREDIESWNKTVDEWDQILSQFNDNIAQMDGITEDIQNQLRASHSSSQ